MDEHAKLERILGILFVLANGRKLSIIELTERYNLSERTIRRYISSFRKIGLEVECEAGLYSIKRLEKPFKAISELLHFSEEEAYILSKAIHSIDDNNVLKENLSKKLYSLCQGKNFVECIIKPEKSECVNHIIEAIEDKKQVLLKQYRSAHGKLIRDRLIEPFGFTTNYISIWAYEPESQKCKLFKTARIKKVVVLDKHFENERKHFKMPIDVFRISTENQIEVKIQLSLRAYNLLIEEYPLSEQYIKEIDDNLWQLQAPVSGLEGVGRFCLGLCDEVEIQHPQALKEYLKEKIKKCQF
jgi:predicted DNA-binding transcriptional regulator YafY